MAVSTPFVIAIFSLLFAVDTIVNEFLPKGRTYFWSKVAFAAFGLLLSILPVVIGISVFVRTKGSRFKVLQKAFLSYLTGDMYNELNYRMWLSNKSVYSNILNEQVQFYRNDYLAVLTPGEAKKIQSEGNYSCCSPFQIEFGFKKGDSTFGRRRGFTQSEMEQQLREKKERYDTYFTEKVTIQFRTAPDIFIVGTLIVKDKFCNHRRGCILERTTRNLDDEIPINEDDHKIVRYNKIYEKTCLGELNIEADYDPWCQPSKLSLTVKCSSFPRGKCQTMSGDCNDFINLIKLIQYYDSETGWIVMKKGNIRVRSRGANIFHGTDFLRIVGMLRQGADPGYDLFEINIDTQGEPCLVE